MIQRRNLRKDVEGKRAMGFSAGEGDVVVVREDDPAVGEAAVGCEEVDDVVGVAEVFTDGSDEAKSRHARMRPGDRPEKGLLRVDGKAVPDGRQDDVRGVFFFLGAGGR